MFSPDKWFGVSEFYNGVATQSLKMAHNDTSHLTMTHSSGGNAKTWTWSGWVKRTKTGSNDILFTQFTTNSDVVWTYFSSGDQLNFQSYEGSNQIDIKTRAKFRDTSAWYHIVVVQDTTQSSSTDRAKMYVNGELQTDLVNTTYPSLNADLKMNNGDAAIRIGSTPDSYGTGAGYKLNGYIAEVNFLDGYAYDPSYFGETKNGVWIPKIYTGAYGSNGFRLQFKETGVGSGSSSTVGADTSGNDHHFTSTNIVASDCNFLDSPENSFSYWNFLFRGGEKSPSIYDTTTLSEAGLRASVPTNSYIGNNFRPTSGKWYVEFRLDTLGSSNGEVDWGWIQATEYAGTSGHSGQANKWGVFYHAYSTDHIRLYDETSQLGSNINLTISAGNILQLAWDIDNAKGWVGINNTWYAADNGTDGNPSAGTNQTFDFTADEAQNLQCYVANGTSTDVYTANFGQDSTFAGQVSAGNNADANGRGDFQYAPPTGFLSLCTANLADTTIGANSNNQANDFFNAVLYTSNNIGSGGTQNVTGVGFQPDLVWIKNRSSNSTSHTWYDSTRGTGRHLASDSTSAEVGPNSIYGYLSAFGADGFTLTGGTTNANYINQGTDNYVSWNFKANGGTTTTNDASATGIGTIDSVIQADDTAGFSIVSYTGTQTLGSVKHGLSTAPNMVWIKNRSSSSNGQWVVGQDQSGFTGQMYFDQGPFGSNSGSFNNTAPTSSVVTINTDNTTNENGDSFIMYCFSNRDGYLKVGSYEGNNSSNGTFIFTGFRPAFLLVKSLDTNGEDFHIFDDDRATFNVMKARLIANGSAAENTNDEIVDFVSNGFKWRDNNAGYNNSATFVYLAIARESFKYANAR